MPLAFLFLLLPLTSIAPGLLIVRRLRWTPLETLCGSIATSLIFLYLTNTLLFLTHAPLAAHYAVSLTCLVAFAFTVNDLRRLFSHPHVRRAALAFTLLFLWSLLALSLIRHYSGGAWSGDWLEHFQRALFFLHPRPPSYRFIDVYTLPSRPPFMNLLASGFLYQTAERFDLFQITFTFLNLLVFFPCLLIAPRLLPNTRRPLVPLACLFALSPFILQNATFTWTKLLSAYFVILALAFYLRSVKRRDPARLIATFLSLAAACLIHYSAGPFTLFILLHYLLTQWLGRPKKWAELSASALLSLALLATWFSWSISRQGAAATFSASTAVFESEKLTPGQNLAKIAANAYATFVPHPLRIAPRDFSEDYAQPRAVGYWRDDFSLIYENTLPFSLGSAGFVAALYLLRKKRGRNLFWIAFLLFCIPLAIATHGTADPWGVAHVTLQPVVLLGLTLLAAGFTRLPGLLRNALILFGAIDLVLGTLIHLHIQRDYFHTISLTTHLAPTSPFLMPTLDADTRIPLTLSDISRRGLLNSFDRAHLTFLGDHFTPVAPALEALVILAAFAALYLLATRTSRRPLPAFYPAALILAAGGFIVTYDSTHPAPDDPARSATHFYPTPATDSELGQLVRTEAQAIKTQPHSPATRAALAYAVYRYGRRDLAIDQWTESLLLDPENPVVRTHVVFVLRVADQYPQDIPDLARAMFLRLNPDSPAANTAVADALLRRGHLDASLSRINQALARDPNFPDAWYIRAQANAAQGNLDQAIQDCKHVLELDPNHAAARQALAIWLPRRDNSASGTAPARPATQP